MPIEDILKASRQVKYKLSPDGAKERGVTIQDAPTSSISGDFPEYFQISSLRQFLALPEDFPYRADLQYKGGRIPDGPHNVESIEWGDTFKEFEKLCEEWKKDATEGNWNKAAFSWELACNIANRSLAIKHCNCDEHFIILTLLVDMSFKLGIDKLVARELTQMFEERGIPWQQGLPPLASKSQRGGGTGAQR